MPLKKDSVEKKLYAPYYKWEFIRRNKEYQSDYKKIYKKGLYSRQIGEHLYRNYGMGYPIHPKFSFIEHIRRIVKFHSEYPFKTEKLRALSHRASLRQMFPCDFPVVCSEPLKLKIELYSTSRPCPYNEPWDYNVNVKINLEKPYIEIMQELEYIVKNAKKFYKIPESTISTRNYWVLYEEYLKIWDMKYKEGKSLSEISSEIDDIEDNTRKKLQAAEDMIDGGFRKIGNMPRFL